MATLFELKKEIYSGRLIRRLTWSKDFWIKKVNTSFIDSLNRAYVIKPSSLFTADWEVVEYAKDTQPEWGYIIDNSALCFFWDNEYDGSVLSRLISYNPNKEYPFESEFKTTYKNCRPAKREELITLEDIENGE